MSDSGVSLQPLNGLGLIYGMFVRVVARSIFSTPFGRWSIAMDLNFFVFSIDLFTVHVFDILDIPDKN